MGNVNVLTDQILEINTLVISASAMVITPILWTLTPAADNLKESSCAVDGVAASVVGASVTKCLR